ncbi:MAG: hypothetical protein AAB786_02380 [Patescibacteria group bacterium]
MTIKVTTPNVDPLSIVKILKKLIRYSEDGVAVSIHCGNDADLEKLQKAGIETEKI